MKISTKSRNGPKSEEIMVSFSVQIAAVGLRGFFAFDVGKKRWGFYLEQGLQSGPRGRAGRFAGNDKLRSYIFSRL